MSCFLGGSGPGSGRRSAPLLPSGFPDSNLAWILLSARPSGAQGPGGRGAQIGPWDKTADSERGVGDMSLGQANAGSDQSVVTPSVALG